MQKGSGQIHPQVRCYYPYIHDYNKIYFLIDTYQLNLFLLDFEESIMRIRHMRDKMVARGVISGPIFSEWCMQNEDLCY